jgi:hypothetical protein
MVSKTTRFGVEFGVERVFEKKKPLQIIDL